MKSDFRYGKLSFNWQLGLGLILLFGIPRFLVVLEANRTGSYGLTSIVFLLMILTPFLILTKQGRKSMELTHPSSTFLLLLSFMFGIALCALIFWLGETLYGDTLSNWFVYISESYGALPSDQLSGESKWTFFLVFAAIGITFSPFGEEFLYRGLIHRCFTDRLGENGASMVDSPAFALVHLAHFGLISINGELTLLLIPALLWVILMYMAGRLFYICRKKTGSVFGAVISHVGFNLAMTWLIFYFIL